MKNENAKMWDEASKKSTKIVIVDPSKIVDDDGNPIDLTSASKLRRWLRRTFGDREVEIESSGNVVRFSPRGLDASIKRRGEAQRQMYAELDNLLANSIYVGYQAGDARHPSVERQDIYYAAARIGNDTFGIRFKVDIRENAEKGTYKDHKTVQIENVEKIDIKKPSPPYGRVSLPGTEDGQSMPILKIQEAMGGTTNNISHFTKKVN